MRFTDLLLSSRQSLVRTKARSGLTMLGIIIGVMAVILMLSIGEAAQRYILSQVASFGSDVLYVGNGSKEQEGEPTLFIKESLVLRDVRKIRTFPWVKMLTGVVLQEDDISGNGYTTNVQVMGTMPDEIRFSDRQVARGRFFDHASLDSASREVVLGHEAADKLFGQQEAVGKRVKIANTSFTVIGVMEIAGTQGFQNVDKQVYIPVTTALDLYRKKYLTRIAVKTDIPLYEAKRRLESQLRDLHGIDNVQGDLSKDDFNITTQEDAVRSAGEITGILQILLVSIAAISLVVGGIGIMNIMYVSVTERVKEIGLRKAIGAYEKDVLRQFLIEAVLLTSLGGVIGIALGIGLSWMGVSIISRFQEGWSFGVSWRGVGLGLVVSAAIGIVFGYFPARRAARLNPMQALRAE